MSTRWAAFTAIASILALTAAARESNAQMAEFVTTAKIDRASLRTSFFQQHWRFFAEVTVKNAGATPKMITVWLNPGWSWVTDSKDVGASQEATKNDSKSVTLQPGGVYKSRLEMWADPNAKRPITFRLGFIPNTRHPVQDARDPALVWSNPVTLTE